MDHLHNSDVLMFFRAHSDNANIKKYIEEEQGSIDEVNAEFGTGYRDFLDYLESNIGDDVCFTFDDLMALLKE